MDVSGLVLFLLSVSVGNALGKYYAADVYY